jgi:alpha-tubulin suppressor-like RCC1 family protein
VAALAPANANIVAVSGGWDHSLALSTTGTVYSWGNNTFGQLGRGGAANLPAPVAFPGGTPAITAISAGAYFSLALDSGGQVWSWGWNGNGELGQGAAGGAVLAPAKAAAPANANITAISAGADHALALTSAGAVLCWGLNNFGQCANVGGATPAAVAFPPGTPAMTAVAAGGIHSLALDNTGQVWSWGLNDHGQLGAATAACNPVPDPTSCTRTPIVAGAPAGVVAVAAGWKHSLAIGPGGAVLAWGWNASGQLGDGTKIDRLAPVAVLPPCNAGVSLIAAGYAHSLCV